MSPAKTHLDAFTTEPRVPVPGSERVPLSATPPASPPPSGATEDVSVSLVLRRRHPIQPAMIGRDRLTHAEYAARHGASDDDMARVHAFARAFGLTVDTVRSSQVRRTVVVRGAPAALEKAFAVTFEHHTVDGQPVRARRGAVHVPQSLDGIITAVLGLDNRPQARPHFRRARPNTAAAGFTPPQVAALYGYPKGVRATGQTIALIELGGGYRTADVSAYFGSLELPVPAVTAHPVDGGSNAPGDASGADGEVMLDIEVAGATAPGAAIAVYFAPNTDQGFLDAVTTAVHDTTTKPSVISISWGGPESTWTAQAMTALDDACQSAALLGITITVASGDNGSTDGVAGSANHVDFPASSPHVLGCGGTKLVASGSSIGTETAWNELAAREGATGGGVSAFFARPTWQAKSNVPPPAKGGASSTGGRGVPDVSGDADPTTGYRTLVDGQSGVIGGTSAVAPLWAGLIALSNAQAKQSAGFLNAALYATPGVCRDILSGTNGAFEAGPGWDACTGLGSPVGSAVAALIARGVSGAVAEA